MAVGRLVLAGLAAAGVYGVWRRRQPGPAGGGITRAVGRAAGTAGGGGVAAPSTAAAAAGSATTMPDQSSPVPPEPTGGLDTAGTGTGGAAASGPAAPAGAGGAPDFTADATALDGTTSGPGRDALAVPSAHGADPAAGAGVEGTAALHTSGTRGDDPLTGVTEAASDLPEPTASADGTPAAGPVETRRVGDDRG